MNKDWKELVKESPERKFDYRLLEKKVEEKFMSRDEIKAFLKERPEITEYAFSSYDELMAEENSEETPI